MIDFDKVNSNTFMAVVFTIAIIVSVIFAIIDRKLSNHILGGYGKRYEYNFLFRTQNKRLAFIKWLIYVFISVIVAIVLVALGGFILLKIYDLPIRL